MTQLTVVSLTCVAMSILLQLAVQEWQLSSGAPVASDQPRSIVLIRRLLQPSEPNARGTGSISSSSSSWSEQLKRSEVRWPRERAGEDDGGKEAEGDLLAEMLDHLSRKLMEKELRDEKKEEEEEQATQYEKGASENEKSVIKRQSVEDDDNNHLTKRRSDDDDENNKGKITFKKLVQNIIINKVEKVMVMTKMKRLTKRTAIMMKMTIRPILMTMMMKM